MSIQGWEFLNKGNANIILRNVKNKNVVLRLRQRKLASDEGYKSTIDVERYLTNIIMPHFKEFMIPFKLYQLGEDFLLGVNSWLKENYTGVQVELTEQFGILMENCINIDNIKIHSTTKFARLYENDEDYIIEIKPKWLYPDLDSYYCRNCLTERLIKKTKRKMFCSLGLISDSRSKIEEAVTDIFKTFNYDNNDLRLLKEIMVEYCVTNNSIFRVLSKFENLNNNRDQILQLTSSQDISSDLSLGMSLRDVTVFISWNKYSMDALSVKLLDIDPKSHEKWSKWKADYEYLQVFRTFKDDKWGSACGT